VIKKLQLLTLQGRNNVIIVATRYGLYGPGIEYRWGEIFFAPVHTDRGAHPVSYARGTGSLLGVKRPKRCAKHPSKFNEYSYSSTPPLCFHGRL